MKKIIMLSLAIMLALTVSAQSDYTYLDAVKALTETGSLKTLGEKGYQMRKEAQGTTHELFFTKGKYVSWRRLRVARKGQQQLAGESFLSRKPAQEHRHYLHQLTEHLNISRRVDLHQADTGR